MLDMYYSNTSAMLHRITVTTAFTTYSLFILDEAVKVVKPKDSIMRGIHSPAGIQSPKPNSPGFLLGASNGVGGRAFSVYTSRSGSILVTGSSGAVSILYYC